MTTSGPSQHPPSSDTISRSIVMEGQARRLEPMREQSEFRGFTIFCDEPEPMGHNTAPPPLAYFASSLLF